MSDFDRSAGSLTLGSLLVRLRGEHGLVSRSRRASGWTLTEFGGEYGLRLVSNLILTRLLAPEVFGLMALAQVFLEAVRMSSDVGTQASVIRSERGDDEDFLRTAWTVQVIRGFLISAVGCLIAWPVSLAYDQPALFPVICALSLTSALSGFFPISVNTASRKLQLRQLTLVRLLAKVVTVCVTILFAWTLESVWALVFGAIAGTILNLIGFYAFLPPFRHRFCLEREALRELVRYGRWILLGTLFAFLATKGQQAIYGFLVPLDILGAIAIALLLATILPQLVSRLLTTVVFPAFSEIRRERPQDLPRALRRVRLAMMLGIFPIFFLIAVFAQPIVDLLYDDRYAVAGAFLSMITLNSAITVLSMPYQNLLLAEGRSDLHAFLAFLMATLGTGAIVAGYYASGIFGSFVGVGVAYTVHFLANVSIAWRRGYVTWLLDFLALILVWLVYAYVLSMLEIPSGL
jgi:O-antigen/teichoic acid export membrane protein